MQALLRAIKQGESSPVSVRYALKLQKLMDDIEKDFR